MIKTTLIDTLPPPHPPKNLNFSKLFFVMIFLKHLLNGLATLSFNRYKTAQSMLRESCILCFETILEVNKITPTPTPTSKNKKNI